MFASAHASSLHREPSPHSFIRFKTQIRQLLGGSLKDRDLDEATRKAVRSKPILFVFIC